MNQAPGRFFPDLWKSATDFRFYGKVACLPFRLALGQLLKISLGLGTVITIVLVVEMFSLNPVWEWFRDTMPAVRIRGGVASAEVEQPFVAEHTGESGVNFAVIIDTTGKTPRVPEKYRNAFLLKKRGFAFKVGDRTIRQEFGKFGDVTIDRDYFDRFIITPRRLVLYIALAYLGVFILLFAQSAAVALAGRAIARIGGIALSYGEVLRMSFYALALAVFFLVLVILFGLILSPRYLGGVYIFIHVAFLTGGVLAARKENIPA